MINEEYFFNNGKYLGAQWYDFWYKRSYMSNVRGERSWFDREI